MELVELIHPLNLVISTKTFHVKLFQKKIQKILFFCSLWLKSKCFLLRSFSIKFTRFCTRLARLVGDGPQTPVNLIKYTIRSRTIYTGQDWDIIYTFTIIRYLLQINTNMNWLKNMIDHFSIQFLGKKKSCSYFARYFQI